LGEGFIEKIMSQKAFFEIMYVALTEKIYNIMKSGKLDKKKHAQPGCLP